MKGTFTLSLEHHPLVGKEGTEGNADILLEPFDFGIPLLTPHIELLSTLF